MNDEQLRLAAVRATGLLDTPAEGRFDRITRIARRLAKVPIATITLVDEDRQWFKSALGLVNKSQDPRNISFCSYAIEQDDVYVVEDAAGSPLFRDNPLVTGKPGIRFYAGAPIRYNGQRVGTLCVIDTKPRPLNHALNQDLQDLAKWVESEIDSDLQSDAQRELISEVDRLREMALVDPLTRTWNRNGIQEIYNRELAHATRDESFVGCILIDIDHFKSVNDTYGHDMGDAVLKRVADRIRLSVRPYDSIGRMGGEEFLVLLPKSSRAVVRLVAERIRSSVECTPIELTGDATLPVTISLGTTYFRGSHQLQPDLKVLFKAADVALYEAKKAGRNRVVEAPEVVQSEAARQA